MITEDGKIYTFEYYSDDELAQRIAYWEGIPHEYGAETVLTYMYDERERRIPHQLIAWAMKGGQP